MTILCQRAGLGICLIALMLSQACCGSSNVTRTIAPAHPLADRPAPDFIGTDVVTRVAIATRGERGTVRIYFFGATWCGSCDQAWEQLDVLRTKYLAQGLIVVGIAEDSSGVEIKNECKRLETATPVVDDKTMSIAGEWRVSVLPSLFVIDRTNTIRFVHTGYRAGDMVEVEREVEKLLVQDSSARP